MRKAHGELLIYEIENVEAINMKNTEATSQHGADGNPVNIRLEITVQKA